MSDDSSLNFDANAPPKQDSVSGFSTSLLFVAPCSSVANYNLKLEKHKHKPHRSETLQDSIFAEKCHINSATTKLCM